jgi:hypothetical protein
MMSFDPPQDVNITIEEDSEYFEYLKKMKRRNLDITSVNINYL